MAETGAFPLAFRAAVGSCPSLLMSKTWTVGPLESATASRFWESTPRPMKASRPGEWPSRSILNMSNPRTSNTLMVLSAALQVAQWAPVALTVTSVTGPRWARNCFTNSTPFSCFFQNFTTPSTEAVMKKSRRDAATCVTRSRCI